ncbi:uncharacterized protein LOC124436182 [Xenia sp. Carnegie-2017]|uniref:uncharacterized protein LOC124436182 n=1 Tax=Xenia sp. Carnegie-2017 TaxID=2897299 RepID=UPI001F03737E|nr:uncharacterized protein LOC124436182 [Xenia sp. Carnegie-2017]XP_046842084.1 uncharacterized protein LOC124436182 [Xenia sp. Carnegie-2017]
MAAKYDNMATVEKFVKDTLKLVEKTVQEWEMTKKSSNEILESFLNLHEQLTCCEEAEFPSEFMNDFPDVKKRVIYKITKCLNDKMKKLNNVMKTFEGLQDGLQTAQATLLEIVTYSSDKFDLDDFCKGNVNSPPLTMLFECIIDITTGYSNLYEQTKDLVTNIRYDDKLYFKTLAKKWKDNSMLTQISGKID